jgi:hypothetical protein
LRFTTFESFSMSRIAVCSMLSFALCSASLSAAESSRPTIKLKLDGAPLEGTPLFWQKSTASVLGCDGRLWHFETSRATSVRTTNEPFESWTITKMRAELQREFGPDFEVTAAGHYVVVHPRGHGQQWSSRFEELYRSFRIYFAVRGFQLREPQFPLAAVVLRTQQEFQRYVQKDQGQLQPGLLGYYSPQTNRVALYDVTGGQGTAVWHANAETIIHEATHQTAFNTGIHSRFSPPPRWVAEGLGTLFEARGVWDSRFQSSASERVNWSRLAQFRQYAGRRKPDAMAQLINSDRVFRTDPDGAYAEAWALSYFLIETRPQQYAAYLARTAARPDFHPYPRSQRLADFTAVFGDNLRLLDAQFLDFMEQVR